MEKKYNYPKENKFNKMPKKKKKKSKSKSKTKSKSKDKIKEKNDKYSKGNKKKIEPKNIDAMENKKDKMNNLYVCKQNLTSEEKNELIQTCLNEIEGEKNNLKLYFLEEENKENSIDKNKRVHEKKYLSIEVEENIETINSQIIDTNTGLTEVKYRKFNNNAIIEKRVLYDGYEF